MHRNVLPGQQQPYFLESGEGERHSLGPFLATIIGNGRDTGALMEGVVLTGAKDSAVPLHGHKGSHEAIYVLEGSARLRLGDSEFALEGGDYASVPPGTAHSFTFTSHRTRLLTWTFGGNGAAMYAALGEPSEALIYSPHAEPPDWKKALPGVDVEFLLSDSSSIKPGEKSAVAPDGIEPYVIPAGEGEHMMAGDTLFSFLTDGRQSGGKFLVLMTDGPKGHRIPNHLHEKHTETFFCLNGCVSMTAGEEEVSLRPGDFLHVPAGTPHTFQLTGNNTRFIQFHAPGVNEPFFRYLCDPCEEYTFLQPPPPFRFDRVMQHLAELDVKFLE
jgi:quercetin 2,3-dioxygenase